MSEFSGGKRHVVVAVFTWPHSLLALLPIGWAIHIMALVVLQARCVVPRRNVLLHLASTLRGQPVALEQGDLTFEYPPRTGLVWEVLDTYGKVRPYLLRS